MVLLVAGALLRRPALRASAGLRGRASPAGDGRARDHRGLRERRGGALLALRLPLPGDLRQMKRQTAPIFMRLRPDPARPDDAPLGPRRLRDHRPRRERRLRHRPLHRHERLPLRRPDGAARPRRMAALRAHRIQSTHPRNHGPAGQLGTVGGLTVLLATLFLAVVPGATFHALGERARDSWRRSTISSSWGSTSAPRPSRCASATTLQPEDAPGLLRQLVGDGGIDEAVVVSACNRLTLALGGDGAESIASLEGGAVPQHRRRAPLRVPRAAGGHALLPGHERARQPRARGD